MRAKMQEKSSTGSRLGGGMLTSMPTRDLREVSKRNPGVQEPAEPSSRPPEPGIPARWRWTLSVGLAIVLPLAIGWAARALGPGPHAHVEIELAMQPLGGGGGSGTAGRAGHAEAPAPRLPIP